MVFLLHKYTPKFTSDIVGNEAAIHKLKDFVTNYQTQKRKVCIIHGPLGVGKTSLVYALTKELDYDILEINSSELRNKDAMSQFISSAIGQMSLFMKPKVILIDEADNTSGRKDRGGMAELAKIITKSKYPIVCTANDILDNKIKPLTKVSLAIEIQKPNLDEIVNFLKQICEKENIDYDDSALSALARSCDGDIRALLLDLQILKNKKITLADVINLDDRKRTQTILHALRIVFKSTSADTARMAFDDVDVDPNTIISWMEYNLPKEYTDAKSLEAAFNHLSRADIFQTRIRKWQHWRYLVYIFDLLSAGISTAKVERNPRPVEYSESSRGLKIWMARNKNAKKLEIAGKYATKTHVSTKVALEYIPHLKHVVKHSSELERKQIFHELELSDEEIAWLKKY